MLEKNKLVQKVSVFFQWKNNCSPLSYNPFKSIFEIEVLQVFWLD